jgi:ribosome-associated heat shock protein Hsp15
MPLSGKLRIDKWLWAVRIYKTRSQASEACQKGRVIIDGIAVKPSRIVKIGDVLFIRKLPVIYTIRVKDLSQNRLPAKRVVEFAEDLTSVEELEKLSLHDSAFLKRDKGSGRPTKKERRMIDDIIDHTGN